MEAAGITALLTILGLLLRAWLAAAPKRAKEALDAKIQQGRQDIANGNESAVSARIDSVSKESTSNSAGLRDDEDTKRRLTKITRV